MPRPRRMASADELLPVCSWDFAPDPANVYSLCVLDRPAAAGAASYPTLLVATTRELLAYSFPASLSATEPSLAEPRQEVLLQLPQPSAPPDRR